MSVKYQLLFDGERYGIQGGDIRLSDISTKKSLVQGMVDMFNRNDLSLTHFLEAVEDFLP